MKNTAVKQVTAEKMDIKAISEKLGSLPHDKLMYVAGAIIALSAAANTSSPTNRPA